MRDRHQQDTLINVPLGKQFPEPGENVAPIDARAQKRIFGSVALSVEEIEIVHLALRLIERAGFALIGNIGLSEAEDDGRIRALRKQSFADNASSRRPPEAKMKRIETIQIFAATHTRTAPV